MSITRQRIQRTDLPMEPRVCKWPKPCVYRKDGVCDEAQVNKGNSDATCYTIPNRVILVHLVPL